MPRFTWILSIAFSLLLLPSCARRDAAPSNAPHATVYMRDGSQYAGKVVSSSPAEITLAGDDNVTHTLAMNTVKSIDYDEAPAQAPPPETARQQPPPPESGGPRPPERRYQPELNHEYHRHPEPSDIQTRSYVVPAGTELPVRVEETIDSGQAVEGQTFAAEVTRDVLDANGAVVIPRGANAQIVIRSASRGGRFRGSSDLVLDLASVSVGGRRYQLSTADLVEKGKAGLGANKRTAEYTGGGAAIGAIIGAIAGHGKGAAIGAGSGAAAGAVTQMVTKGSSIRVPVESVLPFRLDRPLRVVAR